MDNIELQKSDSLDRLLEILGTNYFSLNKKILKFLWEWEILGDEYESMGTTLGEVIDGGSDLHGFCVKCLNLRDREGISLVADLKIMWSGGNCPECGYHTEKEGDGGYGMEWELVRCLNANCGHICSTEALTNFSFEDN